MVLELLLVQVLKLVLVLVLVLNPNLKAVCCLSY